MSTRQSGLEISNVQSYRDKLFSFLGDHDPLDVLAQTASALQDIVRENSAEVLRTRPFQGKWTPNEIIGHLSDSECGERIPHSADSLRRQSDDSGDEPGLLGHLSTTQ